MTSDNIVVVGIRTSEREWFSISVEHDTWTEAGLEPNSGCSELTLLECFSLTTTVTFCRREMLLGKDFPN